MLDRLKSLLKSVDNDTKLTLASLALMFVVWLIDAVRDPFNKNEWLFPLLILIVLAMYLLMVSQRLKHEKRISALIEENQNFLQSRLPSMILKKIQVRKDVSSLGISRILPGRDDNQFLNLLRGCSREVSLMAVSLYNYVSLLRTVLPPLLAEKQLTVRILILKQDSPILAEKEREENLPGRIAAEIRGVEGMLKDIIENAISRGYRGKMQVGQYEGITYCSLYVFDKQKILYNPYLRRVPGKDVPVYEIDRQSTGVFKLYIDHFESVWNDSRTSILLDSTEFLPKDDCTP